MESSLLPEEKEWDQWRTSLPTRALLEMLRRSRQGILEQWAAGVFQTEDVQATAVANAAGLAEVRLYERLLELDYDQLKEVLSDERSG